MANNGESGDRHSKAELLNRIESSYSALMQTLDAPGVDQAGRTDPQGWGIKDHLVHLAAWEKGVAELLRRRSRYAGMGLDEAWVQGKSFDEINAVIQQHNAGLTYTEALDNFKSAHRDMLLALDALSDEDLYQPYSAYLPSGSSNISDPVINRIAGNTFGHFDEHRQYIEQLLS